LAHKVALCDHPTAAVLLQYGADPFALGSTNSRVTEASPLINQAAQSGCHQIVASLLEAAARATTLPTEGLRRLLASADQFGRTAEASLCWCLPPPPPPHTHTHTR
jgi:hypothetical protein